MSLWGFSDKILWAIGFIIVHHASALFIVVHHVSSFFFGCHRSVEFRVSHDVSRSEGIQEGNLHGCRGHSWRRSISCCEVLERGLFVVAGGRLMLCLLCSVVPVVLSLLVFGKRSRIVDVSCIFSGFSPCRACDVPSSEWSEWFRCLLMQERLQIRRELSRNCQARITSEPRVQATILVFGRLLFLWDTWQHVMAVFAVTAIVLDSTDFRLFFLWTNTLVAYDLCSGRRVRSYIIECWLIRPDAKSSELRTQCQTYWWQTSCLRTTRSTEMPHVFTFHNLISMLLDFMRTGVLRLF